MVVTGGHMGMVAQILCMYLLHKKYTESNYHMYRVQVVIGGSGMVVDMQSMNILHKIYTVSIYHMYCIEVVTLG